MASINKAIIIGSLGRDPETRYSPSGDAITTFSVATSETWKDKEGVKQEKTEWHNVVAYRKLAEICGEYLKKGSSVYLEGKIATRQWEKDGVKRYATEIIIDTMQMLGGKDNSSSGDSAPKQSKPQSKPAGNFDDFDDDDPWK